MTPVAERTNWRKVADALAARMLHHDYCDNGHVDITEDCANCKDRAALKVYWDAGGKLDHPDYSGAQWVTLDQVRASHDG